MRIIRYIGNDAICKAFSKQTGITWTTGMTATVLDDKVAAEMLKHPTVFVDASNASDPVSAQAAAIAAVEGRVDGVQWQKRSNIGGMQIVAHRGGPMVCQEEALSAYQYCFSSGIKYVECDCDIASDGTVVLMHDSTVDRTTDGTGNVSSLTISTYKALKIDSLSATSPSIPSETPINFGELLDWAYGKDVVVVAEAKSQAVVSPMLGELQRRGWPIDRAVVQCSGVSWGAPVLAAGYPVLHLIDTPTTENIAASIAAGHKHIGSNFANTTQTHIDQIHAGGAASWIYTVNRRSIAETFAGMGADFLFCDDPVYMSGDVIRRSSSFDLNRSDIGMLSGANTEGDNVRATFVSKKFRLASSASFLHGYACPIAGDTYKITLKVTPTAGTTWFSAFICAADDSRFNDQTSQGPGYHILFRLNGTVQIYKKDAGVSAVSIASQAGSSLTLGTEYTIEIDVSPTSISATCNGATAVANDATYRGGYIHTMVSTGVTLDIASLAIS